MIGLAGFALLLSTHPAHGAGHGGLPPPAQMVQLQIQSRTIIRVPVGRPRRLAPMSVWRERRTGRCIDSTKVAGAAITPEGAVDFVLRGGKRIRAWLESECPALDFYQGFYVKPDGDGKVCAGRDAIHSRSGGECQIDRFRQLEPVTAVSPK